MKAFSDKIAETLKGPLQAEGIDILQVNLGYRCNMACSHCHVEAGPARDLAMEKETVIEVLRVLGAGLIPTLDVTGGAPELNPHFRFLVSKAKISGCHVIVRTNLTVFFEEGMQDLPEFMHSNGVEITASMPCYTEANVDRARGEGTFRKSITALRRLNGLGYGTGSDRRLNLVYNPSGAFLCGSQKGLEDDYRREFGRYGIAFDRLYAFANAPIGRFREHLVRTGGLERYMEDLSSAFNPGTLGGLMCRRLVSVGWDGRLHDCDFNHSLGLGTGPGCPKRISDFDHALLAGREIRSADHCYVCAAGQGST